MVVWGGGNAVTIDLGKVATSQLVRLGQALLRRNLHCELVSGAS